MALYLGLDVGTQATKALVVEVESGRVVARAASSYGLLEGLPPGAAEQHPETWIEALRAATAELWTRVDPARIAGLGVSGQQHGLVVLDAAGAVVRPAKLWCDTSTAEEARELSERLERHVPVGYTASKVLWLARHEPQAWARTRAVLLPHDYVNYRLTGRLCMEAGDASGTGFFDPLERVFPERELAAVDPRLGELLPPLLAAGELAGELSRDGAELLGLRPGLPVSAGGGDNMMSAIGSGATRAGIAVVSLGTSGTAFTHSDVPRIDPAGLIAPFCGSTGGWLPLLCVMNLTGVTEEVRAAFGGELAELTARAREVPAGCEGLLWLPFLAGERVPDLPGATGTLLGMRPGCLRPEVLFRAAIEGTSLNLAWGVERLRGLGLEVTQVRLVGGGARNRLWREVLAETLACPVAKLAEEESAALGAALQAAWSVRRAAGEERHPAELAEPFLDFEGEPCEPTAAGATLYAELGQRFRLEVERLYGIG